MAATTSVMTMATATLECPLGGAGCRFTDEELPELDTRPVQSISFDPAVRKSCVLVAQMPFLNTTTMNLNGPTFIFKALTHQ